MKKGRHRRFEEARKAKRAFVEPKERCVECGGNGEDGHASWCLAVVEEEEEGLSSSFAAQVRPEEQGVQGEED